MALAAGEGHIGQVGGTPQTIQATLNALAPVIAAAGDYTAGDVLSDAVTDTTGHPFVFAGAARTAGGGGWIVRLMLTLSVDAAVPRTRWWFFNAAPTTTEQDDNAAFDLTVADRTKLVGYIDLPALADAGHVAVAQNISDKLAYRCAGSGTSLFSICQTLDAFTNEAAGMTATVEIQVEQH